MREAGCGMRMKFTYSGPNTVEDPSATLYVSTSGAAGSTWTRRERLGSPKVRCGASSQRASQFNGRTGGPKGIVGANRPGRVVVFTGDTRPCAAVVDAAQGADLLIHEATFGEEEKERAKETGHSTAREAAQVALAAKARRLVLSHVSARYSISAEELVKEARDVFKETVVAKDGMTIEVPFSD